MMEDLRQKQEEIRKKWILAFAESPINTNKYIDITEQLKKIGKKIAELEGRTFYGTREIDSLIARWRKENKEKRRKEE